MNQYLPTALALACAVLIVSLFMMKRSDAAQHKSDAGAIAGYSNRLWSAQTEIAICKGMTITLSNRLEECQSAVLTFSNQLTEEEANLAAAAGQITNLTRQAARVAGLKSENQALEGRIMDLTNQMAGLTRQIASAQAGVVKANKNYALLENRLRQDVAGRVVTERKFNNPAELEAQLQKLKKHPAGAISAQSIYAGLDVEVYSNGTLHVLSPD